MFAVDEEDGFIFGGFIIYRLAGGGQLELQSFPADLPGQAREEQVRDSHT